MLLPASLSSLASGLLASRFADFHIPFRKKIKDMAKQGKRGLRRLVDAAGYSAAGLAVAWRGEEAFRQEVLLAVALLPLALWLGQSPLERLLLVASWLVVMIVEILNTAVEATVDRISDERHRLSGEAKDLGSAAVFLSLLLTALVWGTVAWQRFAA